MSTHKEPLLLDDNPRSRQSSIIYNDEDDKKYTEEPWRYQYPHLDLWTWQYFCWYVLWMDFRLILSHPSTPLSDKFSATQKWLLLPTLFCFRFHIPFLHSWQTTYSTSSDLRWEYLFPNLVLHRSYLFTNWCLV